jgi:hypothetical protein
MLHLNEQESTKQTTGDGIERTGFIRSFYHGSSYYQFKLLVNTLQIYTNHFDGILIEKLEFESSQAHVHNPWHGKPFCQLDSYPFFLPILHAHLITPVCFKKN